MVLQIFQKDASFQTYQVLHETSYKGGYHNAVFLLFIKYLTQQ